MKKSIHLIKTGAVVALGLGVLTAPQLTAQTNITGAAGSTRASANALGHLERVDKLRGKAVHSTSNQRLGKIDDLVLDLTSGRVLYTVVSTSKGKVAVAPGVFTEVRGDVVLANVDLNKLEGAPQFTSEVDNSSTISRADFVAKTYQYFGQNEWWQGATAANAGSFNDVHKASDLAGMNVEDVSNHKIGDVKNVMVNLPAGRIVYVILSPASDLKLGNNLYALPPDALTPSADHKSLVSNLSRAQLASAPHITKDNWAVLSNPSWAARDYQYYGKQAYFENQPLQPTGR